MADSERPKDTQASNGALSPAEIAAIKESKATQRATKVAIFSALIAFISAVGSIVLSLYSAHLVGQQNSNTQQQELVSLVTDIEQGQRAANEPDGSSVALVVLGEAEEANNIIAHLHSNVSSVEKYIVGLALEDGDDYEPALTLLTNAAKEKSDPRTTADSWRAAAAVLYRLNMNSQAENDINTARESYIGVPGVSEENDVAFTDFFDIPFQVSIGHCSFAENGEWDMAAQLIENYHQRYHRSLVSGSNAIADATTASKALLSTCKVPPGKLKAKNILGLIPP